MGSSVLMTTVSPAPAASGLCSGAGPGRTAPGHAIGWTKAVVRDAVGRFTAGCEEDG